MLNVGGIVGDMSDMSDICGICKGGQYLFGVQDNKYRWFSCPSCNGVGTIHCYAPNAIKIHGPGKVIAKLNKRLIREEKELDNHSTIN